MGPLSRSRRAASARDGGAEQPVEPHPIARRQPDRREPPRGAAQVDRDHDLAQVRPGPLERRPASRREPAEQVDGEDLALVVEADLLEVVEQPRLGRPEPPRRAVEQDRQGSAPPVRLGVVERERPLEPPDQEVELGPGVEARRLGPRPRRVPRGPGPENRGSDHVAPRRDGLGASDQPARHPPGRLYRPGRLLLPPLPYRLRLRLRARRLGPGGGRLGIGRASQPRRREEGRAIDVACQRRADRLVVLDPREDVRQQHRGEIPELQVRRGELDVGRPVVAGRQQHVLLPEHRPDLVELDPADPADPVVEDGIGERPVGESPLDGDVRAGMEQHSPVVDQHQLAGGDGQFLEIGAGQQDDDRGPLLVGPQPELLPLDHRAQLRFGDRIDPTVRDLKPEEL